MADLVSIPRLTEVQEALLLDLAGSESGGLRLAGPCLRTAQHLAKLGLAELEAPSMRWYEPTEKGRKVAVKLVEARR